MRWDTLKQKELDLQLRIKVLKKQLIEPDRSHEQYEEIQTTLDIVLEEYQSVLLKKFKKSLAKWIKTFSEENLLIRTVDCMFASLEKEDQNFVAKKWYKSIVDHKDFVFYKNMSDNRKLENDKLKKQIKENKKVYRENLNILKKSLNSRVKQSRESVSITHDQKVKEIVDIMQARYDRLNENYNQCKIKYTNTFVEMNNKLVELQKDKKDVES